MKTKLVLVLLIVGAIVLPRPAIAATILFDFNSLAAGINSASNGSPFPAANPPPDRIEDYMEDIYGSNITVLLGAQTRTSRVENRPNGGLDMYLGNSDGATDRGDCTPMPNSACHGGNADTFLINRWDKTSIPANLRDRIVIIFLDVPIMGFEVDWEIFPVTGSGQAADITIKADGLQIFFSELLGADKENGDLGHFSISFTRPVHRLEFIDWTDAPIAIDNLRVTQTPVPGTVALLVAGCLAFALSRRERNGRPSARCARSSPGAPRLISFKDTQGSARSESIRKRAGRSSSWSLFRYRLLDVAIGRVQHPRSPRARGGGDALREMAGRLRGTTCRPQRQSQSQPL